MTAIDIQALLTAVRESADLASTKLLTDTLLACGGSMQLGPGLLIAIKEKDRTHRKQFVAGKVKPGRFALVTTGAIELFGIEPRGNRYEFVDGRNVPTSRDTFYSRTFRLGEMAEYHSFNLSYYGEIRAISAKRVTIVDNDGSRVRTSNLDLQTFDWRNAHFDLEKKSKHNAAELQCI